MREYVLSLTATALISGILMSLVSEDTPGKILRLVCGVLLAVTALKPLTRMEIPDFRDWTQGYGEYGEDIAAMGQEMARAERMDGIRHGLETYILDKAAAAGLEISVRVFLEESTGKPVSVQITGDVPQDRRLQLQNTITNDLGIPGEAQEWITRKENMP